ncbi:hypothetical protein HYS00_02645 [Candidatus Microgenomates bacterium]|nr:hypothetical protein [Candidatus Microgenomates bacterium]
MALETEPTMYAPSLITADRIKSGWNEATHLDGVTLKIGAPKRLTYNHRQRIVDLSILMRGPTLLGIQYVDQTAPDDDPMKRWKRMKLVPHEGDFWPIAETSLLGTIEDDEVKVTLTELLRRQPGEFPRFTHEQYMCVSDGSTYLTIAPGMPSQLSPTREKEILQAVGILTDR